VGQRDLCAAVNPHSGIVWAAVGNRCNHCVDHRWVASGMTENAGYPAHFSIFSFIQ
jgi:3-deoxy-D-arabino-heptulosonate 7-phosphate (DAHP) synthase